MTCLVLHHDTPAVRKSYRPDQLDVRHFEARWLTAVGADHAGEILAIGDDENDHHLVIRFLSGATAASLAPGPRHGALLLAETARMVTRLHRRAICHGNLHLDHLLCQRSGGSPTGWSVKFCSPKPCNQTAHDVVGLSRLMRQLSSLWPEPHPTLSTAWAALAARFEKDQTLSAARAAEQLLELAHLDEPRRQPWRGLKRQLRFEPSRDR